MIVQSPESEMPEPYTTYVRQRSAAIADVLGSVMSGVNVQLCPRAILENERIYNGNSLVYGAVVERHADGYKSVLYSDAFGDQKSDGLATDDLEEALGYAESQFSLGNRVRLKDPRESDGNGQYLLEGVDRVEAAFTSATENSEFGVVMMPHLVDILHRVSVGSIQMGETGTYTYLGTEQAIDHNGKEVYGGTSIGLYREGASPDSQHEVRKRLDVPCYLAELGIRAIQQYSVVASRVGRVSVDVVEGYTDSGQKMRSVIDITPRVGGVTPAEVMAVRELHANPGAVCFATSRLIYYPETSPATGKNFVDTPTLAINAQVDEVLA